jgi:molybdopterin-guanine dinucleotide biosynthesis protein A
MQDKHNETRDIACAIFAGGENRRMGRHKAFLDLRGKTFLHSIIDYTSAWFEDIFIVTNDEDIFSHIKIPVFEDIIPDKGPLSALHTALTVSKRKNLFCVACDMPFSHSILIERLVRESRKDGYDCFVPLGPLGPEPLFAIYRPAMAPLIEREIESGQLSIMRLFKKCRPRFIRFGGIKEELVNINTPEEYKCYADKV